MPKVSVVVPVYNTEKYLRKCLDSILTQTLSNIEIICINNGSTDSCPEILNEYADKDQRIRAIHQTKNVGYGGAENIGIENAEGEYIGFVDSDDYVLPDMYETLYYHANKYALDIVKQDHYVFGGGICVRTHRYDIPYNQVLGSSEKKYFFYAGVQNWKGIYKKEFLVNHQIWHREAPGAIFQDVGFWVQTMSMAQRIMWVDRAFYMYRWDNPSQTTRDRTKMMNYRNEYIFAENILIKKGLYRELDYMNAFRLKYNKFAFCNRIGVELKKAFAEMIIEDYLKYSQFMYADDITIDDSVLKWYDKLIHNTELVCDDAAEKMQLLDGADKIILYGAGRVAKDAYMRIYNRGAMERLKFVAVTKKDGDDFFGRHRIKEINELLDYKKDLVIVAVWQGSQIQDEMVATLKRLGFENYIVYRDLIS